MHIIHSVENTEEVNNNEQTDSVENANYVKLFRIQMTRDMAYYLVDILCLILLIVSFVTVAVAVQWVLFTVPLSIYIFY